MVFLFGNCIVVVTELISDKLCQVDHYFLDLKLKKFFYKFKKLIFINQKRIILLKLL